MLKYAPAILLAAIAVPAASQNAAPQAASPAKKAPKLDPLDKVVCRTEEGTGSRLSAARVCLTIREWNELREASRDAVERIQQGQGTVPSG
jgi:hypothetical protein